MQRLLTLVSVWSPILLCAALACNESKLADNAEQQPGLDQTGGDTDNSDPDDGRVPTGQGIVKRVGKLFDLKLNLRDVRLPSGVEQVRLRVVDADGSELPEAIMMWRESQSERPEWLNEVGTRVAAEFDAGQQAAQFEDLFLRVDLPAKATLRVSVVAAGKEQVVRQHPLQSEAGKYTVQVVYAEPGIRGVPVIEFNFEPGIPARHKGTWYVAARTGESNVSGYGIVASSFSHLPMLTTKLIAHPHADVFDTDSECYVALVNIDDNVKADHFGACGTL